MVKQSLLAAAALVAVSAFTSNAHANPIYVGYSIDGGKTINDIGTSGADGTAGTGGSLTVGNYAIQISATGQSAGALTSLFSNTLTITSTTTGSIILYASETNNTARATSFTTGFSNDSQSSASVTESSYLGLANSKYSTTSPSAMSMVTLTPGQSAPLSTVAAPTLPSLYSLTEAYAVNFTNGGRIIATLSVTSANAVPEPLSIAVLGSGLAALGLIGRRKRV